MSMTKAFSRCPRLVGSAARRALKLQENPLCRYRLDCLTMEPMEPMKCMRHLEKLKAMETVMAMGCVKAIETVKAMEKLLAMEKAKAMEYVKTIEIMKAMEKVQAMGKAKILEYMKVIEQVKAMEKLEAMVKAASMEKVKAMKQASHPGALDLKHQSQLERGARTISITRKRLTSKASKRLLQMRRACLKTCDWAGSMSLPLAKITAWLHVRHGATRRTSTFTVQLQSLARLSLVTSSPSKFT
mmetsp:Transcript_56765/g.112900  ORF Transcript_56765/g.112900 Transcript_56765/m.112900 type:complete len:243 (-) Transcript_56765:30-758(-)